MPAKPSGEVKTRRVRVPQKNGDIYILERQVVYDPAKKYDKVISSRLIGKIPKGQDTIVETRPKRAKGASKEQMSGVLTAKRTHVGMMGIIDHIGKTSGIDAAVYAATDVGTAQKILSLARYFLATNGQPLPGITTWQLNHRIPYDYGITEDIYHDLFQKIGLDESIAQNFFRARCSALGERDAIAFDSTTISTYSDQLVEARYGYNKADDGLKTVKYLTLYSIESRQPIAFTKQAGNLPDVITVANALKELDVLGLSAAEIITDNGYYSESNLSLMLQHHFNFITLIKNNIKWVKKVLDEHMDDFDNPACICSYDPEVYAVTVPLTHTFRKTRKNASNKTGASRGDVETFTRRIYLHIFFDRKKQANDRVELDRDIAEIITALNEGTPMEDLSKQSQKTAEQYLIIKKRGDKVTITYNKDAFRDACRYHGFFVLVANKEKDSSECLRKYRTRERIEDYFTSEKQRVDGTRTRVWDGDVLRGRMFVQFVALCYYEYFSEQIRQMKKDIDLRLKSGTLTKEETTQENKLKNWVKNTPVYLQLQWFDAVEEVEISTPIRTRRWNSEIILRDQLYLERLGIDPQRGFQ